MFDVLVVLAFLFIVAAPSMVAMKNAIRGFSEDPEKLMPGEFRAMPVPE